MRIKSLLPDVSRKTGTEIDHPFYSLQREMNSLFDNFFRGFNVAPRGFAAGMGNFTPSVDVKENEKVGAGVIRRKVCIPRCSRARRPAAACLKRLYSASCRTSESPISSSGSGSGVTGGGSSERDLMTSSLAAITRKSAKLSAFSSRS